MAVSPLPIILGFMIPLTVMVGLIGCARQGIKKDRHELRIKYVKEAEEVIFHRVMQALQSGEYKINPSEHTSKTSMTDIECDAADSNQTYRTPTSSSELQTTIRPSLCGNSIINTQAIAPQRNYSSRPPSYRRSQPPRMAHVQPEIDSRMISEAHAEPKYSELSSTPISESPGSSFGNASLTWGTNNSVSLISEPEKVHSPTRNWRS